MGLQRCCVCSRWVHRQTQQRGSRCDAPRRPTSVPGPWMHPPADPPVWTCMCSRQCTPPPAPRAPRAAAATDVTTDAAYVGSRAPKYRQTRRRDSEFPQVGFRCNKTCMYTATNAINAAMETKLKTRDADSRTNSSMKIA